MTDTFPVFLMVLGVVAILGLWFVPKLQVRRIAKRNASVNSKDLFDSENEARRTLAQILGGAAILATLYFNFDSLVESRKQIAISQSQARTAEQQVKALRDGQITDRFSKAVEELGASDAFGKKVEVRQGAMYALERISRDSERDYMAVMEIQSAYVRNNARTGQRRASAKALDPDVQTALTVLGRRKTNLLGVTLSPDMASRQFDLHGLDLSWAWLPDSDLENVYLRDAVLDNALLEGAHLGFAWLKGASLRFSHLRNADLKWANLENAKGVTAADIRKAANWALAFYSDDLRTDLGLPEGHNVRIKFASKNYDGYPLANAQLEWDWLDHANFRHANLRGANLRHAHLEGAILEDAHLEGADLTEANVSRTQIQSACTDSSTRVSSKVADVLGQHHCE